MKKQLLIGVLIWLIILPLNAQEIRWESSCDEAAQKFIAPVMGEAVYNAGCAALKSCLRENSGYGLPPGCEFPVYDALIGLCEGDLCDLQGSFYMASLMMFQHPVSSSYSNQTDFQAVLADTLIAFQAGDYPAVIDAYEEIVADLEYPWNRPAFLDFIVGLMYETLGELETASSLYKASIELYRMPFVTWQRAEVLLELGHKDVAAAEAVMMGAYPQAETILKEHSLPEGEDWLVYPVERYGDSEGGFYGGDYTVLLGMPFKLIYLSDGSMLLLGGTDTLLPPGYSFVINWLIETQALLLYPTENGYALTSSITNLNVTLTFEDAVGTLHVAQEYVMGGATAKVLIAPVDVPDPREGQDKRCDNGARWQLIVGGYGAGQIYGTPTQYFDAPDGKLVGTFSEDLQIFRVVSGPECVESQAWWEVDFLEDDDSTTYWLPEAEAQSSETLNRLEYYVYPTQAPQQ